MINLIPKEEKKKMVRNFYYNLIILFFVMISVSFSIAFVSLLPSYFLSSTKNNIIDIKIENQKKEPVPLPDQKTLAIIEDLNHKLSLIENAEKNRFFVSKNVIDAVVIEKMPSIKITEIIYNSDFKDSSVQEKKIGIEGTAPSREALLSFRLALESSSAFKQVDLPISNFVKGSDIQFYLNLIPSF